jgi:hypothetical protein
VLGPELAARVRGKEFARIEPVLGGRTREDRGELTGEGLDLGAAVVPEGPAVRHLGEAEDLLDAAVAVGRDEQDGPGEVARRRSGEPEDDVVVELALRPVGGELVAAEARGDVVEQGTEDERAREGVDHGDHRAIVRTGGAAASRTGGGHGMESYA